jgi:hypothetical protein
VNKRPGARAAEHRACEVSLDRCGVWVNCHTLSGFCSAHPLALDDLMSKVVGKAAGPGARCTRLRAARRVGAGAIPATQSVQDGCQKLSAAPDRDPRLDHRPGTRIMKLDDGWFRPRYSPIANQRFFTTHVRMSHDISPFW